MMFSNMANLKFLNNVCKTFFRRLGVTNAVDKQKDPFIIHTDKLFAEDDVSRYNSRLPELLKSICDDHDDFKEPMERFATNMSQLLPDRMLIEGLKVMECYNTIPSSKSDEETKNAEILGWCCDIIIHIFQITDDIMEHNKLRWGKPSYYTWEDVGMYAVNDAVLLEHVSYFVVKKFFRTKPWYRNCVELIHDVCLKTAIGQSFETCLYRKGKLQFQNTTLQNFKNYAIYQGAYPGIQLPLMMAHFAAENYEPDFPKKARNIIDELGLYITVQNDMVDFVSDDETAKGSISDIGRGGFNWLITQALSRGTSAQKEVLKQHYGVNNSESIQKVTDVYEDLKIVDLYEQYKKNSLDYVCAETEKAPISKAYKNSILKLTELLY